jgi:hypothetical protein
VRVGAVPRITRARVADPDEPVDLLAVEADDEALDALAGVCAGGAPPPIPVALAHWRAWVDAQPVPELVEVEIALLVLADALRTERRRPDDGLLRPRPPHLLRRPGKR